MIDIDHNYPILWSSIVEALPGDAGPLIMEACFTKLYMGCWNMVWGGQNERGNDVLEPVTYGIWGMFRETRKNKNNLLPTSCEVLIENPEPANWVRLIWKV